jgi:hypothetical protein
VRSPKALLSDPAAFAPAANQSTATKKQLIAAYARRVGRHSKFAHNSSETYERRQARGAAVTVDTHDRRMLWFATLTPAEQRDAIQQLPADGISDHDIASATRLSVEMIRQILVQRPQCEGCEE